MHDPVYELDLRIRGRERRLWILASVYLLVPVVICPLAIVGGFGEDPFPRVAETIASFAIFGHGLFLTILSALSTAERISREREQRTLPALVNTPLSPARIADGKLRGAWTFTVWLATVTLPVLAIASLWGGLALWQLAACWLLDVLVACAAASLSLGLSGLFGRSLSAYLATGAVLFVWYAVAPVFSLLVCVNLSGETQDLVSGFLFAPLPYMPQFGVFQLSGCRFPGGLVAGWLFLAFGLAVWAGIAALGRLLAVRSLKRDVD